MIGSIRSHGPEEPACRPRKTAQSKEIRFSGQFGTQTLDNAAFRLYFAGEKRKLMSYNAEQFYYSGKGQGRLVKPLESVKALAEVILKEDPDVIAMQEVGGRSALSWFNRKYLNNQYPNIVSLPVPDNAGDMRVAMMSKANIKVVDAKSHWKEVTKGTNPNGKRDFLEATFETDTGYRFTVYNAHCKSMNGGEQKTAPIRQHEAQVAAKIMSRQFQQDPQAAVFLTGDLNTRHDTPFGQPVLDTFSMSKDADPDNDLTEVMLKDGKPEPTHYGAVDEHGQKYHPDTKLDYTFVSKSVLKNLVRAYVPGQFGVKPWSVASDHRPLVTEFEEPDQVAKPQFGASRLELIA